MEAFLRVVRDIALLLARIVAGAALVLHGWTRWQVTGLEAQVEIIEAAGLPSAQALALATVVFEIGGGVLLVFGLGTPIIGLGMVVLNMTIALTVRSDAGFALSDGGWEYNAAQAALGLVFLAFGSGRAGLDHLFVRPSGETDQLIEAPA
ncbi:DoxX family protein [Tessaracoccus defluvii]|uniref:DoxX family protein n=1 Tax=Tessaracoccus defluvii TaxID=1285901 RepID=A0A7H0H3A7_9ACTN|nr:DoxX family protein [Tessaracoccus defluvii]QNP55023.1 DoxX family protein [Tessaracoccus defluvii]